MTILDKISENASNYPERMVYYTEKYESGEMKALSLSWKSLEEYSDKLAAYLERILSTKKPVIVYGHKHPYMIVCFLACVKSGRAYCPVDVSVPMSRMEAVIHEVEPEIILAAEPLFGIKENILSFNEIVSVLEGETGTIDKEKSVAAEDIFYIIFTSGSTGTPKGVQITTDCLDNFIGWAKSLGSGLKEGNHYTVINQAPFSFDLSVMDLYLVLYTGGTLWAADKNIQSDMKRLLGFFEKSDADVWVSTPSFADVCLADKKFSQELLPELRMFLFCGETLTNRTVNRLSSSFPKAEIVNTYGPTESTVAVAGLTVTSDMNETYHPLPVGRVKNGTWVFIMDENGEILPDGEKGEIVIAGDTVSIGYWNNKSLTQRAFGTKKIGGGNTGFIIQVIKDIKETACFFTAEEWIYR